VLLVVTVLTRPPSPGWPPDDWVLAMCDVGQGDGLVLRAGPGAGVVVDAGPDPVLMDDCLRRLEITSVPLVVLTHFHDDHVAGLPGVLDGRQVGELEVTGLPDPATGVRLVEGEAAAVGVRPVVASYGATRRVGDVTLQTLWPMDVGGVPHRAEGEESAANDASVVLLVEVRGVRILLTGDVEPSAQRSLERLLAGVEVDVLKVPHHGSRHQDLDLLLGVRARLALVSVGADNTYGHPSADLLAALTATGAQVRRTDLDGDVLVTVDDGALGVRTRD
jgi:competence protein ComEC